LRNPAFFFQVADHKVGRIPTVKFAKAVKISLSTNIIPEIINTLYIKITEVLLLLHLNPHRNVGRVIMEFTVRMREGRQLDFMLNS